MISKAFWDWWLSLPNDQREDIKRSPPVRPDARKRIKYCGGITCLPGLGGTCVGCAEDD